MAGSESYTLEIAFLVQSQGLSNECHSRREQRPWHWTPFSTDQPGHLSWHYPLIYQTWEAMSMCFLSKNLFICSLGVGWPFWGAVGLEENSSSLKDLPYLLPEFETSSMRKNTLTRFHNETFVGWYSCWKGLFAKSESRPFSPKWC